MTKMINITEEERERRRQNMLTLHQEGRAGAQYGKMGGRPRKPRASEQMAEKVAEDAEAFYQRLKGIALEGADKNAVTTILGLLKIEEQERKIVAEAEEKIDQLRREELIALVANQLGELQAAGTLPRIIAVGESEVIRDEGTTDSSEDIS